MSQRRASTGLADALFSVTQQRVLGLLFGQPERSFYATQLMELSGGGSGAVQRELERLERTGLVTRIPRGTQKHYQANPKSPIYDELCSIIRKTVGLADPIRDALSQFGDAIQLAFVHGSVAKGTDSARSDIDLFIVGDTVDYASVITALQEAEAKLARPVNPTIFKRDELNLRLAEGQAFATRVMEQPKLWVIGDERSLRTR